MKKLSIILGLFVWFLSPLSHAQTPTVFEVRSSVAMSNDEKVYKDFYINAGIERGLKPGVVITVKRVKSFYDSYQNKTAGDLFIPVGDLKIIFSRKGLSVARLYNLTPRVDLPVLDYTYIMIGDRVDLDSIRVIKKKTSQKRKQKRKKYWFNGPSHGPEMPVEFASKAPVEETAEAPILQ